jgi:hypothetical protein
MRTALGLEADIHRPPIAKIASQTVCRSALDVILDEAELDRGVACQVGASAEWPGARPITRCMAVGAPSRALVRYFRRTASRTQLGMYANHHGSLVAAAQGRPAGRLAGWKGLPRGWPWLGALFNRGIEAWPGRAARLRVGIWSQPFNWGIFKCKSRRVVFFHWSERADLDARRDLLSW